MLREEVPDRPSRHDDPHSDLSLLFEIPAILFALFWLLSQIIPGIAALMMPADGGGIAWWAHIGGFAVGWVLAPLVSRPARGYRHYYSDEGRYGFLPNGSRSRRGQPWV